MRESLQRSIVQTIEHAIGRHDEQAIYGGEPGDLGLVGGPDSLSWELHGDLASIAIVGYGAVLMEILHPSVLHGVSDHSNYRADTAARIRNTLGYVLQTTFGSTPAAKRIIEGVRQKHARVVGKRPDGVSYAALDPDLLTWVHTSIPWGIMSAFERYNRPLSVSEKDRYLAEQAPLAVMAGAEWAPSSVAELEDYVSRMRPQLVFTERTVEFLDFLCGKTPLRTLSIGERIEAHLDLLGAMSVLPRWSRRLTGLEVSPLTRSLVLKPYNRYKGALVRWAYPELPCKAIALRRANAKRQTAA